MHMRLLYTALILGTLPTITLAAVSAPRDFKGLVAIVTNLISTLIVFIFALTFLVFMWGVIKSWIIGGGDTEGVESGKKVVVTGIIALVVMSSIWGILYLLQTSFFK